MRIGFDAKRAFNNTTGLGNYSRFVLDALMAHRPGNEYLAYTPTVKSGLYGSFPASQIHVPDSLIGGSVWRSRLITSQLQKDKIEIFHGLSGELPIGLRRAGIRSVVTVHDLIFRRFPELYKPIDRWLYDRKARRACHQADAIVAVSEQTKRDIVDFYRIPPDKIKVVYQDCDESFHQKANEKTAAAVREKYHLTKPYVLCVATIELRKNQLNLVKAFGQLNLPDHELLLVGRKTIYQSRIEKYIAQNRLANVRIFNHVPFADLPALYQNAAVFAYPSFFEGFGIQVVEALHSGVPVVAATGSCLEEAGGQGSLYADPHNVDELAQKLHTALTGSALRNSMVREGQIHVRQFAARRIAGELAGVYGSL